MKDPWTRVTGKPLPRRTTQSPTWHLQSICVKGLLEGFNELVHGKFLAQCSNPLEMLVIIYHPSSIRYHVGQCACMSSAVSDSSRCHGPIGLLCPWNCPGKNTGVGCHFLLQGILLTQGLNPCLQHLLHWQADSLPLSHLGSWDGGWQCEDLPNGLLSLSWSFKEDSPLVHLLLTPSPKEQGWFPGQVNCVGGRAGQLLTIWGLVSTVINPYQGVCLSAIWGWESKADTWLSACLPSLTSTGSEIREWGPDMMSSLIPNTFFSPLEIIILPQVGKEDLDLCFWWLSSPISSFSDSVGS